MLSAWRLVRASIVDVPANRYAAGVVGVVAAGSVAVHLWAGNAVAAVLAGVAVLAGMVILRLAAGDTGHNEGRDRMPIAAIVLVWACLAAFIGVLSIGVLKVGELALGTPSELNMPQTQFLSRWEAASVEFQEEHGGPGRGAAPIKLWQQFFDNGTILWDSTNRIAHVIIYNTNQYRTHPAPERLFTEGTDNATIKDAVLDELLDKMSPPIASEYESLARSLLIRGGIGTLFIEAQLLDDLGMPSTTPESYTNLALWISGRNYNLLLGAYNHTSDVPQGEDRQDSAAYALFPDGMFRKWVLPH